MSTGHNRSTRENHEQKLPIHILTYTRMDCDYASIDTHIHTHTHIPALGVRRIGGARGGRPEGVLLVEEGEEEESGGRWGVIMLIYTCVCVCLCGRVCVCFWSLGVTVLGLN
jgi:hypothetical protein